MKANERLPTDQWYDYLNTLSHEANPSWMPHNLNLVERLQAWQKRFEVYHSVNDKSFKSFNAWQKKNKLRRVGKKLHQALLVYKSLEDKLQQNQQLKTNENYKKMQVATYNIIEIELLKLEITQLRMLEKAQNLRRNLNGISLTTLEIKLTEKRHLSHQNIESRSSRFSIQANEHQLTNVSLFFKSHEKKIHFTKHFRRSDKVAETVNVASSFNNLRMRIEQFSSALFNTISTVGAVVSAVLQAIPFINAIISAIPIVILATKTWLRNKSKRKKIFAGILMAVVIGMLVTTGFGTIAAAAVVVGLMAISTFVKHVHPWWHYQKAIREKKNELIELDASKNKLISDAPAFSLTTRERQFLMVKIEEAFISGKIASFHDMQNLIMNSPFGELNSNPKIYSLLNEDLKTFLLNKMDQREKDLKNELYNDNFNPHVKSLTSLEKEKRFRIINGLLSITGVILLCIPGPTMIIGAALLVVTAVVTVAITFKLGEKLSNLARKLFSGKSENVETSSNDSPTPKPTNNSTFEVNKDLNDSPPSTRLTNELTPLDSDVSISAKPVPTSTQQHPTPLTIKKDERERESEGEGESESEKPHLP